MCRAKLDKQYTLEFVLLVEMDRLHGWYYVSISVTATHKCSATLLPATQRHESELGNIWSTNHHSTRWSSWWVSCSQFEDLTGLKRSWRMSVVLDVAEDHAQSHLLMLTALEFGFLYHRVQSLITPQFFQQWREIQWGIHTLTERIQFHFIYLHPKDHYKWYWTYHILDLTYYVVYIITWYTYYNTTCSVDLHFLQTFL
jgi:hypothetical protein